MGESESSCSSEWSWEENKLFETALTMVDEAKPRRWVEIAAMIGGKKTAEEVRKHYEILLEDLEIIESGLLDLELYSNESYQPVTWTDDDQKAFAQLSIEDHPDKQCPSTSHIRSSSNL